MDHIEVFQEDTDTEQEGEDDEQDADNEQPQQQAQPLPGMPCYRTFVNSVGIYNDTTETIFTSMPSDYRSRGIFIPLPENIRISNLRATVESLSDPETPVATRAYFENHNPIPGTRNKMGESCLAESR